MSNPLMGSLGLDEVESDPNHIPAKETVPGSVYKSEYVKSVKKGTLAHVITYKVDDGHTHAAKEQQEWFTLGIPSYDDEGNLSGIEVTMSEKAKSFYKRRLETLGVTDMNAFKPSDLVATKVDFSVRHANGYQNIANVELRDASSNGETTTDPTGFSGVNIADL